METQLVVPAGQASSQNAFSLDSGDSHPTVVNIELRQAWDGAWYPLVAQQGEPSFASHYVDSAQYFWELAASRTRKAVIISLSPEPTQEEYVPPKAPPLQLLEQGHVLAAQRSHPTLETNSDGSHLAVEPAVVAEHDGEELRRKALEERKN